MTTDFSFKQLLILSALIVLAAINVCAYTPAIPAISHYFQQPMAKTQGLVVISLLAHCFGPLTFAAVGNRFSRLKSIYVGLAICLLGDVCCLVSAPTHEFRWLMAGMFFLSFGGNMGMTMALTLIRDRTLALLEKTFSLSMISFAVLPGLAITLSGFLLGFSQWPSVFLALAAYHLILLFKIAQAAPPTANLSLPSKLISLRPLGHKRFWILLGIGSCMTGMTYTFSALAPKIVLHELGVSTFAFGLWSNVPSVGMLIGNCTALRFQEKHFMKVLTFDIFIHLVVIILLFLCVQTKNFNVGIFFGGIALMGIGGGMAYPLMTAQLLRHSEDHASTAALFTMLHFLMASQIVNLANHLPWQNILNLLTTDSLCMVGFATLALCYNIFILRAPPLPPQHPPENA